LFVAEMKQAENVLAKNVLIKPVAAILHPLCKPAPQSAVVERSVARMSLYKHMLISTNKKYISPNKR
jgi:hypothetical protein